MNLENISLEETGCFSPIFIDYLKGKSDLNPFYGLPPTIESFSTQINQKQNFPLSTREILYEVLCRQYEGLDISEPLKNSLDSIKNKNTFTVTTGHQLNICTGPLYFIYKIITVINACRKLKTQYPEFNFIPVYWMASEDHDLEEINHFFLFGEKVTWNTDQTGPVGRMNLKSIDTVLEKLPEKAEFFREAYQNSDYLADAVRNYVNALFGKEGLVVLDADDAKLKGLFAETIKDDIRHNRANQLVEKTSSDLDKMGYKTQVFPREINFFYLEDGLRNRLLKKEDGYKVKGRDLLFSEEEISKLIDEQPEKFSPNVILRPLYQETILPNLAYIGGPAEIAYWLQLKPVFDHYQRTFPILMPRNFGLIIPHHIMRKLSKVKIPVVRFFNSLDKIKKEYITENTDNEIHLDQEINHIRAVFDTIKEKAGEVDPTLEGFVGAEGMKTMKSLENIEKKIKKSEERNQEVAMQQISSIKEKLFPKGNLQERYDNYLSFYVNNPALINQLLENMDPFDYSFHVLKEVEIEETTSAG